MMTYLKYFIQLFITSLFTLLLSTACLSQNVTLTTQAEVDAFDSNTTSISGYLFIDGDNSSDPITNLNTLSNLTSILGNLDIHNNDVLQNIDELSNLTSIGGNVSIDNNDDLQDIDGLSNLTTIGGDLLIYFNASLQHVDGLSNLISIGGYLQINYNSSLENIDGLSSLTSIGDFLNIYNNPVLINCCGIQNLLNTPGAIVGGITIANNPSRCSSENEVITEGCSFACEITLDTIIIGHCNPNGTFTDPSDDTYEVIIRADALYPGPSGTYSVSYDGATAYGPYAYGQDHTITLPADGNTYTLFFSNSDSDACIALVDVSQESCSSTATIELDGKSLDYSIFPNPTKQNFQIEITGNTEKLDIQIYNFLGQKVFGAEMIESTTVETNTWMNGMYSVVIYDKNGKLLGVEKVLKVE